MVLLKTFSMGPNLTTHFGEGHQEEPSADASSCSFLHMATSRVQAGIQRQRRGSLHMATCAVRTARMGPGRPVPGQVGRMGGDLAVGGARRARHPAQQPFWHRVRSTMAR